MKIIFICGLPGSGKTFYGNQLSKETGFDFIDDVKDAKHLDYHVIDDKSCIVSDPNFIFSHNRERVESYLKQYGDAGLDIPKSEWIFFENNPEQCIKNVELRNDGRKVIEFIRNFSKVYEIPINSKVIKVYSGE